jgi:hypothetical protein
MLCATCRRCDAGKHARPYCPDSRCYACGRALSTKARGMPRGARTYLKIPRVRDGVHLGVVLDGDRRRVLDVHKASDGDEIRPNGAVLRVDVKMASLGRICMLSRADDAQSRRNSKPVLTSTRAWGILRSVLDIHGARVKQIAHAFRDRQRGGQPGRFDAVQVDQSCDTVILGTLDDKIGCWILGA